MEEYKTKAFERGMEIGDPFKEDLELFVSIQKEKAELIAENMISPDFLTAPNLEHRIQKIQSEHNIQFRQITSLIKIVTVLLVEVLEPEESLDDLADDLILKNYLKKEKKNTFIQIASLFKEQKEIIKKSAKNTRFSLRGAPILYNLKWSSNLRFIPVKAYKYNINTDDYKPEVEKFIPIANIELDIHEINRKSSVNFQVDLEDIEEIIIKLNAIKKELILLDTFYKRTLKSD